MKLPAPNDPYMRQVFSQLERSDSENRKKNENIEVGKNALYLTSDNGTRYRVVVSNLGVLSTVPA